MDTTERTWMEISLGAIAHNYDVIQQKIGVEKEIIAVLKGNAYGLGAIPIARLMEQKGCRKIAVACFSEAMELREAGIQIPILMLGILDKNNTQAAIEQNIEIPIVSYEQAYQYNEQAKRLGKKIKGQLKLDVGLSRFGIVIEGRKQEAFEDCRSILQLEHLEITGVMTHFTAQALPEGDALNRYQIQLFREFVNDLKELKKDLYVHCASSYMLLHYPETHMDGVRVAGALLGLNPPEQGYDLKASVALRTRVIQLKEIPKDAYISYGPLYQAKTSMKIGIVPVGFADGLKRSLSNTVAMIYKGKPVSIVGKMAMDYSTLDLSAFEDAKEGDIVTVFGKDGSYVEEAWSYAKRYPGTVAELTSIFSGRIPRIHIE